MKYTPRIRIISVDHALTVQAAQRLSQAMHAAHMRYPVREVFCHLEAGRCGLKVGSIGIELDGNFVWAGHELTEGLAASFCESLQLHVDRMEKGEI